MLKSLRRMAKESRVSRITIRKFLNGKYENMYFHTVLKLQKYFEKNGYKYKHTPEGVIMRHS